MTAVKPSRNNNKLEVVDCNQIQSSRENGADVYDNRHSAKKKQKRKPKIQNKVFPSFFPSFLIRVSLHILFRHSAKQMKGSINEVYSVPLILKC
jgi:hypothetical protein